MAYVVKEWQASPQPNENGEYIRISGRKEGIVAWLLSFFGIDPTVHMIVTAKNFKLEARTFWGYSSRSIPVSRISEIQDGFARAWLLPIIFWVIGGIIFLNAFGALFNGQIMATLGILFVAAIFFGIGYAIYVFWRVLVVGAIGTGGHPATITFKPSFIEGKSINGSSAEEVGKIIQILIDSKS